MTTKSSTIPIMSAGDPATKGHLFALLLEVRDLFSNVDMENISKELSAAFALSDEEKARREEYLKIISDGEAEKTEIDEQRKDVTARAIKAENDLNEINAKLEEVSTREELVKKAKEETDSRQQAQDARDLNLNTREGNIVTGEALLEDKRKEHAQKESQLSTWENKLQNQQNEIQGILNKMK